jgi:hypothetical protein
LKRGAAARSESITTAGYYPDVGKITVKLLAEEGSGSLLGRQTAGADEAVKRNDAFAAALHDGFTIEDSIKLDFGCAPHFSPVWDP